MKIFSSQEKAHLTIPLKFPGLRWRNFLALTLAGAINAFGVTIFLYPVNLYDSGISGTSMLLAQVTPEFLPLSIFLVTLNIPLFLFGWKRQGTAFRYTPCMRSGYTPWVLGLLPMCFPSM